MAFPRIPSDPSLDLEITHSQTDANESMRGEEAARSNGTVEGCYRREQRAGRRSIVMMFMIALSRVFKDRKVMLTTDVASARGARVCNLRSSFRDRTTADLLPITFI